MSLPLGLIGKGFAGVCCVGTAAAGSGAFMSRGNWTELDEEVYKSTDSSGTGIVDPTGDTITLEAGKEKEIKISASTSSSSPAKKGECVIKGTVPADAGSSITSKVGEQLTKLKTGLGITNGSGTITGQPSNSDKGKKFFDKCIESRSYSEWWEARKGTEAKSTINIKIVKVSEEYKFEEAEFKKLYTESTDT